MYQVLARKWRPQDLEALVGQPHVARTLRNAVGAGRFAHAYLFAGLRGTGKTTVARILAKCLNCEQGPTATPCNRCSSCLEIAESRSMDVLEVDAASRTGVDDVRELQEVVSYTPVRDRYRVLIIDEAHMLSKAAFNALLKTLEEPPPRVVFVLATTEMQKVLPTILSRCQVFEFRRVPVRDVAAHLRRICDEERVTISDGTLERIALAGEGSVRDSLSVLERILAFCGETVPDDEAFRLLGNVRADVLADVVASMAARDAARLLGALDGLVEEGFDLLGFWGELVSAVRDLLIAKSLPDRLDILARPADEVASLLQASEGLGADDLTRIFQILADLEPGLKASGQPRYLFEAALIRIARLAALRPIEEIVATLGAAPAPARPATASGDSHRAAPARPVSPSPPPAPSPSQPPQKKKHADPPVTTGTLATDLLNLLHERRPPLAAMLDPVAEARLEGEVLILTCPSLPEVLRRTLERDDYARALDEAAAAVAGRAVRVRVVSGQGPSADASAGPDAPPAPQAAGPDNSRSALLDRVKRDPPVQKLFREFGAQVIDVRPHDAAVDRPESADPPVSEESP